MLVLPCFVCHRLSVRNIYSIVAKRCVLEQKLLLTAKSYMRNRLVPKWMNLTVVMFRGRLRLCQPLRYIRHWISWNTLEKEAWFQITTNRKWPVCFVNNLYWVTSLLQWSKLCIHSTTLYIQDSWFFSVKNLWCWKSERTYRISADHTRNCRTCFYAENFVNLYLEFYIIVSLTVDSCGCCNNVVYNWHVNDTVCVCS